MFTPYPLLDALGLLALGVLLGSFFHRYEAQITAVRRWIWTTPVWRILDVLAGVVVIPGMSGAMALVDLADHKPVSSQRLILLAVVHGWLALSTFIHYSLLVSDGTFYKEVREPAQSRKQWPASLDWLVMLGTSMAFLFLMQAALFLGLGLREPLGFQDPVSSPAPEKVGGGVDTETQPEYNECVEAEA